MKNKDHRMLEEAYKQVNEFKQFNEYEEPVRISDYVQQKEIDLGGYGVALIDDDETVITPYIDPSDFPDMMVSGYGRQAWVVNDPSKKGWYVRIHTGLLETNPEQAGYKRKPKMQDKPNISSLAKQDPREVEGYGRTYQEAKGWGYEPWAGEQGDIEKELMKPSFQKKKQGVHLTGKDIEGKEHDIYMNEDSIYNDIVAAMEKHNVDSYKELAKAIAEVVKDQYGSHIKMDFLTTLNRELSTSKE
jgi:hypothetical protein